MTEDLRYELKLVCEGHWLAQARSWIRLHPAGLVTAFPSRWVNNIYFDTPHLDSLNANLSGVSQRQKLRLRWYGRADYCDEAWLELKVKQNLLGDKHRVSLPDAVDLTQTWPQLLEAIRLHLPAVWPAWLHSILRPTLFNRYQREYYVTRDGSIRTTLDYAQYACDQRFARRPNLRRALPVADQIIIEIKASLNDEDRLQEIVGDFPIPRSRNSKYINGLLTGLLTQ